MKLLTSLTILLTLSSLTIACNHKSLNQGPGIPFSKAERKFHEYIPVRKHHSEEAFHPLRIHIDYTQMTEDLAAGRMDQEGYDSFVNGLFPALRRHMEATFRVPEASIHPDPQVTQQYCGQGEANFPAAIAKETSEFDLLLIFRIDYGTGGSTIAYASLCQRHPETMRPIVGRVAWNPVYAKGPSDIENLFGTGLHEIYHAMGFANNQFPAFIHPVTRTFSENGGNEHVLLTLSSDEAPFKHLIKTKHVLDFARKYYNNPNLQGVPVEDQGGAGSKGSHWERLAVGNDIMCAAKQANEVISEFTLRLFEDTGWYQVNYDMTEFLIWGRGQTNLITRKKEEICDYHGHTCDPNSPHDEQETLVSFDYTNQGYCNDQPSQFENHCHFIRPFGNRDCRVDTKGEWPYGAPEKRMFKWVVPSGTYYKCFEPRCEGLERLIIADGSNRVTCTSEGQKAYFEGTESYIQCPNVKDFCFNYDKKCPQDCNLNGRCVRGGKCFCYPGFTGAYCGGMKEGSNEPAEQFTGEGTGARTPLDQIETPSNAEVPISRPCTNDCSNQGFCSDGVCQCNKGFKGEDCSVVDPTVCPNDCNNRGTCHAGICVCESAYTGDDCGTWLECKEACPSRCNRNGICYEGTCYCNRGFGGYDCSQPVVWY